MPSHKDHRSQPGIPRVVQVGDRARPVEVGAAAGGRGIRAALEVHHVAVDHVRKDDVPVCLGGEEVPNVTDLVPDHKSGLNGFLKELGPV